MRYKPGYVALERALSKLGAASRREARQLIGQGLVSVNGRIVHDPFAAVAPERDAILVRGERARRREWRTIAFYKPRGCVTTRRDPDGRRTVFDVLGDAGRGLVAVGRLDWATSGLLLLTTDTQLAERLTNPTNAIVRRYAVTVRGNVSPDTIARLHDDVDGLSAGRVTVRKRSQRETHLIVDLTEGKNREVRRLFSGVGHEVTRLMRVAFGPIALGSLSPGEWRAVRPEELQGLVSGLS
jgi:23S rRNA pseudouridine2605 synthase